MLASLAAFGATCLAGCGSTDRQQADESTTSVAQAVTTGGEASGTTRTPTATLTTRSPTSTGTGGSRAGTTVEGKLGPGFRDESDHLGTAVGTDEDGDTVVVGTPLDDGPSGENAGSATVFERAPGGWRARVTLEPDDGGAGDEFGQAVAVSNDGTTAVVGAPWRDDGGVPDAGGAYAFERVDGEWTSVAVLEPGVDSRANAGWDVALSGDGSTALASAPLARTFAFERGDDGWRRTGAFEPRNAEGDPVASGAVALDATGTRAVVGVHQNVEHAVDDGVAAVFERIESGWQQTDVVAPADGSDEDAFGRSVAMNGDGTTAVVGAPLDADPNGDGAGAVTVLDLADGAVEARTELSAPEGGKSNWFGEALDVSVDGEALAVGAPNANFDGEFGGVVHAFDRTSDGWTHVGGLLAPDGAVGEDLGHAAALSGDGETAVAGAPAADDFAGAAYVFDAIPDAD